MRTHALLLVTGALALAGCQPSASGLATPAPAGNSVMAFATLAPLGSFEWHAAPVYTRNAALRSRAAGLLRAKRITQAQARAVLAGTDRVRQLLDHAVALDAGKQSAAAATDLGQARAQLAAAQTIIEGR